MTTRRDRRRRSARAVALAVAVLTAACSSDGGPQSATTTSSDVATSVGDPNPSPVDEGSGPPDLEVRWAAVLTGPSSEDEIDGVAATPDGEVVVTGKFERRAEIGGEVLHSAGMADIPVAQFDADGRPQWVRHFGGPGEDNLFDIDADQRGSIGTGYFQEQVQFDDITLTSAGGTDCVVVALDPQGDVRWARSFGGPGDDGCNEVSIRADGSIITSLDTAGGWDSPAGTIPPLPRRDTVLLALDPSGEVLWARRVGGEGSQRGKAIAVAPDGSIAFGGDTTGPVAIESTTAARTGGRTDAWLSRWSPDGTLQWVTTWGGPGNDLTKGVVVDDDAVTVVGPFSGEIEIDGTALDGGETSAMAVIRFHTDGRLDWAAAVRADAALLGAEAVAADDGGIIFAESVFPGLTFGAADGSTARLDDHDGGSVWVAHYRPDGSVAATWTLPGTVDARPSEIARVGTRLYLDIAWRGDATTAAGAPLVADGKDGSVWALDLVAPG